MGARNRLSILLCPLFAVTLLALLICAAPCLADDWPMDRHDAQNTGRSADVVAPPLALAWRVSPEPKGGLGSLLASAEVVVIGHGWSEDDRVPRHEAVLFDSSGRPIWRLDNASPLYLKGERLVVVVGRYSEETFLRCYDWKTQSLLWSRPLPGKYNYSPGAVESDGVLYFPHSCQLPGEDPGHSGPSVAEIWAVRVADGESVATRKAPGDDGFGRPAVDADHVYSGWGHWLHVLDRTTLEPQWAYWDGGTAYPIVTGSRLLSQGWHHWAQTLDLTERKLLWRMRAWRGMAHCLAEGPGGATVVIEATSAPASVTAVEVATGEILWRHPILCGGYSNADTAAASGHFVYITGAHEHLPGRPGARGGFYCLNSTTGRLTWRYERPGLRGKELVISDGAVYAAGWDGCLYKFVPTGR
jgi:outer membrane protein assembly factor BamB